jgi:plasmid stabilization system protein ParE
MQWLEGLFERVELLQVLPESGRIVPEIGISSIREIIFGQYRVVYRLEGEHIMILTVRHGKQILSHVNL